MIGMDSNPFDEFLAKRPAIFKNREVLSHTYTPERLPHRDSQIRDLVNILGVALYGETPKNILVYGITGSGKTVTVKYVMKKLEEKARELNKRVSVVYVNCEVVDTPYRVLQNIGNNFITRWEDRIPPTGLPTDEVYAKLVEAVDNYGGRVIVVLDEVDKLVRKSGDSILYMLTRVNQDLHSARISLIGISNDLNFLDLLDARVKSSLTHEKVVFPPYNAEQLRDILEDRARLAFNPGVLEPPVIPLCAAFAAKEHGDARRALDILRTAAEIAERNGEEKVKEGHVYLAVKKLDMDTIVEAVKTLPFHEKAVVYAIYRETVYNPTREFTTGELYKVYAEVCASLGAEPVTQRRFTDFISILDSVGIVNARVESRGRYGRTKIIRLATDPHYVEEALKDDEDFSTFFRKKLVERKLELY